MKSITSRMIFLLIALIVVNALSIVSMQEIFMFLIIVIVLTLFKFIILTSTYLFFKVIKWLILIGVIALIITSLSI